MEYFLDNHYYILVIYHVEKPNVSIICHILITPRLDLSFGIRWEIVIFAGVQVYVGVQLWIVIREYRKNKKQSTLWRMYKK